MPTFAEVEKPKFNTANAKQLSKLRVAVLGEDTGKVLLEHYNGKDASDGQVCVVSVRNTRFGIYISISKKNVTPPSITVDYGVAKSSRVSREYKADITADKGDDLYVASQIRVEEDERGEYYQSEKIELRYRAADGKHAEILSVKIDSASRDKENGPDQFPRSLACTL